MRDGVGKAEVLGERMERVRERVKEGERKEGEWVERMRRRVRWCWGVVGGWCCFVWLWGLGGIGRGWRRGSTLWEDLRVERLRG